MNDKIISSLYDTLGKFTLCEYEASMIQHILKEAKRADDAAWELRRGGTTEQNRNLGRAIHQEMFELHKKIDKFSKMLKGEDWFNKRVMDGIEEAYKQFVIAADKLEIAYKQDKFFPEEKKYTYNPRKTCFSGRILSGYWCGIDELLEWFLNMKVANEETGEVIFKPKEGWETAYSYNWSIKQGLLMSKVNLSREGPYLGDVLSSDAKKKLKKHYSIDADYMRMPSLEVSIPPQFNDAFRAVSHPALPKNCGATTIIEYKAPDKSDKKKSMLALGLLCVSEIMPT